ncbi:MAG: prepilin-type N-terminal cleavage/methylation domain-containing protein [Armatimonadetes bacterium]|nr:prepilin-type N-terminal cleavage/methylation domain-containing protein [Armatimonadota bacterium]
MCRLLRLTKPENKLGFTLIEMTIVVLIIGILAMIALPAYMNVRENSRARVCRSHLRHLQDAKERWALDNRKIASDEATLDDLIPNYLKETPLCPSSGTYDLKTVGEDVTCSISGHTMY